MSVPYRFGGVLPLDTIVLAPNWWGRPRNVGGVIELVPLPWACAFVVSSNEVVSCKWKRRQVCTFWVCCADVGSHNENLQNAKSKCKVVMALH